MEASFKNKLTLFGATLNCTWEFYNDQNRRVTRKLRPFLFNFDLETNLPLSHLWTTPGGTI